MGRKWNGKEERWTFENILLFLSLQQKISNMIRISFETFPRSRPASLESTLRGRWWSMMRKTQTSGKPRWQILLYFRAPWWSPRWSPWYSPRWFYDGHHHPPQVDPDDIEAARKFAAPGREDLKRDVRSALDSLISGHLMITMIIMWMITSMINHQDDHDHDHNHDDHHDADDYLYDW